MSITVNENGVVESVGVSQEWLIIVDEGYESFQNVFLKSYSDISMDKSVKMNEHSSE